MSFEQTGEDQIDEVPIPKIGDGFLVAGGGLTADGKKTPFGLIMRPQKDETKGAEQWPISTAEMNNFLQRFQGLGKLGQQVELGHMAKRHGMEKDDLARVLNAYAKSKIEHREKVKHYHRTSIENLHDILEFGCLLSRPELKKVRPDIKFSGASASDNVMMTRDKYDKDGVLWQPGVTEQKPGGSSHGVTLVFKSDIIDFDTYDAMDSYPTVSNVPLESYCEAVLVDTEDDRGRVTQELQMANLADIPVILRAQWRSEHYEEQAK